MATQTHYDESKLVELILYIGAKCGLDEHYGALKLNKVLFYSDFRAFKSIGKPITGAEYRKYPHGPAPACMKVLKERLHEDGVTFNYHSPLPGIVDDNGEPIVEKRPLPRRPPEMEKFSAEEIAIVDSVIEWLRPMTGRRVSLLSHHHPGWKLAEMNETIPYFCALLAEDGSMPLAAADLKRARDVADRYAKGFV